MFGRATITLGIGPHSSFTLNISLAVICYTKCVNAINVLMLETVPSPH